MYPISPLYADFLRKPDREFKVKVNINGKEYDNRTIVDFVIENDLSNINEFTIGTAIPSKLVITLRTFDEIPANAKFIPYVSLSTASMTWNEATYPWNQMNVPWNGGGTDWLPLGEFYVDSREKLHDVWTFTCYDKLVFADQAYVSQLTYPTTQKAVWDEIIGRLGWMYDSSVVINPSYTIQAGPAGYSMRQVLAYIAGANNASIYINKAGTLKFKRFSASEQPVFRMTLSDYIRAKQTNPVKMYTRVVVTYNTEDQLTFEAGTGDENHTLYLENPFATQAITNNLLSSLNGFAYIPLQMDARGFPQLEQGDIIGFEQDDGATWLETVTAWKDTHIPWNGIREYKSIILHQSFGFKGGLKMSIEAPSVSEQQREFQVDGTLTTAVNNLNKTAVKEGKPYYGATITRTEGVLVQREDQLSKAVFNSDELSFYANGQRALWFDLPNRKFKFSGDLEAATGTFSGNLSAAGGTFKGTLQGVNGTFSGSLQAATGTFSGNLSAAGGTFTGTLVGVNGTFSGTLNAATINGGTITGVTVTGSTISTRSGNGKGIVMNSGWADLEVYSGVSSIGLTFAIEDLANDVGLWFARDGKIRAGREIHINAPGGVFVNDVQIG
ncbi:hypothetical protein [Paenibacillus bouchesdurhonensis]|uniref:hypothetical protein n=1 Tax=Paenibacillus bouchesdurhonensis TaxID=1870990 RepID=UPI000DA5FD5F|nr:hypothetical protein [Paenibacillus bouchesdurhonensis]